MKDVLLLPAFYLPNLQYFEVLVGDKRPVLIEACEHFPKQTYRTRAQIATANGRFDLTIPISHGKKEHIPMKDVKISYDHDWQRLHWISLETAYRSSPYFEYYEDDFRSLYEQKTTFLLDFHLEQLKVLLRCLKISKIIEVSSEYNEIGHGEIDYRTAISPKIKKLSYQPKEYLQVFDNKNDFIPNLSVVDLLFNKGPQSKVFI